MEKQGLKSRQVEEKNVECEVQEDVRIKVDKENKNGGRRISRKEQEVEKEEESRRKEQEALGRRINKGEGRRKKMEGLT